MQKPSLLLLSVVWLLAGCSLWGCQKSDELPNTPLLPTEPLARMQRHTLRMQSLEKEREVWVYLPPSYFESERRYPVIYMHDGQNLFEDSTSYVGEWGVDEAMDELAQTADFEAIVVGIAHGGDERIAELTPWPNERYGGGQGAAYLDFVVSQVKPWADSALRTQPEEAQTAIIGSSLGGLISHYALCQYPDLFGKAGVLSPSYWFAEQVYTHTAANPPDPSDRLYLLVGSREGGATVGNAQRMYDQITANGHPTSQIKLVVDPTGQHNEAFWAKHFPAVVLWLFEQ